MTTLERVTLMRKQGISEEEIIKRLQAERISPKEILDSLEQSKIKSAVSDFNSEDVEGMQPSMMGSSLSENPLDSSEPIPVPQPTEETYKPQQINYAQQANYSQQQDYQTPYYQPQEQNYSQEYYPQEGYENYSGTITQTESATETTIEIAEQVVLEKTKKMQKQVSDFLEFKTLFETKIENIEERLKRMEKLFDQMQMSIIEKVSSYGKGLDFLKKEINMVEDSFSKMVEKKEPIKKKTSSKKK